MKALIFISIFFSYSLYAGQDSGGGTALVCTDSSNKIIKWDMGELANDSGAFGFGRNIKPIYENKSMDEIVKLAFQDVAGNSKELLGALFRIYNGLLKVTTFIPNMQYQGDSNIRLTDANLNSFCPQNSVASRETVAWYENDKLLINSLIWNSSATTDFQRASLYIHESLYYLTRQIYADVRAFKATEIVRLSLHDHPQSRLEDEVLELQQYFSSPQSPTDYFGAPMYNDYCDILKSNKSNYEICGQTYLVNRNLPPDYQNCTYGNLNSYNQTVHTVKMRKLSSTGVPQTDWKEISFGKYFRAHITNINGTDQIAILISAFNNKNLSLCHKVNNINDGDYSIMDKAWSSIILVDGNGKLIDQPVNIERPEFGEVDYAPVRSSTISIGDSLWSFNLGRKWCTESFCHGPGYSASYTRLSVYNLKTKKLTLFETPSTYAFKDYRWYKSTDGMTAMLDQAIYYKGAYRNAKCTVVNDQGIISSKICSR